MLVALWWTNHGDTLASGLCSQRVVGLVVGWVTGDTGTVARAPGQRGNPCAGMLPAPAEVTAPAAAPLGKASVSTRGGGKQRGVHVAPSIPWNGRCGCGTRIYEAHGHVCVLCSRSRDAQATI